MREPASARIAVIGLGYVGLPLAVAFGRQADTIGFDIDEARIAALRIGNDRNHEVDDDEMSEAVHLRLTSSADDLRDRDVYIVTVPTPIDGHKRHRENSVSRSARPIPWS